MIDIKQIGIQIRKIRKNSGLNQQAFADAVGVSSGTLSDWVQGHIYPRPEHIAAIAEYFNINTSDLTCKPGTSKLSAQEQELLDLYKSIPNDKQEYVFNFLKTLKASE